MIFGCQNCWKDSPDETWVAVRSTRFKAELIDDSHFHITLKQCEHCDQIFLSVFTEIVDWTDSEDSQFWTIIPLTTEESDDIANSNPALIESKLGVLAYQKKYLKRDFLKGQNPKVYWYPPQNTQ